MRTLILSLLVPVFGASSALAHGGHVADLAGHSHWVGWAAAAAAGAVAAWVIKGKTKSSDEANSEADESRSDDKPETAEA